MCRVWMKGLHVQSARRAFFSVFFVSFFSSIAPTYVFETYKQTMYYV